MSQKVGISVHVCIRGLDYMKENQKKRSDRLDCKGKNEGKGAEKRSSPKWMSFATGCPVKSTFMISLTQLNNLSASDIWLAGLDDFLNFLLNIVKVRKFFSIAYHFRI